LAMTTIRSLRANLTREDVIAEFSPRGPMRVLRRLALGPLRSIADFYIPFSLFKVQACQSGKREAAAILGLEAVTGTLDLYQFDSIPPHFQLVSLETRNCPDQRLTGERQKELVIDKFRRMVFRRGFFRLSNLTIVAEPLPNELHMPYWIGIFGAGNHARLLVLDAVRCRLEGAKVRHLLHTWLAQESQPIALCPDARY